MNRSFSPCVRHGWLVAAFSMIVGAHVAAAVTSPPAISQITQAIDVNQRTTLAGNTNLIVASGTYAGNVADDFELTHVQLLLQRSAAREQALEQYIDDLHNRRSTNFHHWLTAAQFGQLFGPAQQDIATVVNWLQSSGLVVNTVYPNGLLVDFSGTAGQIRQVFGAQMANFDVDGVTYLSNTNDPSIPSALAPVVRGVVSLNNYFPRPLMRRYGDADWSAKRNGRASLSNILRIPDYTFTDSNGTELFVAPTDFNTIYNVNPLWTQGYRGAGQTIVVIEDTAMYAPDWDTFRQAFGLSGYAGTFNEISPLPPGTAPSATNCYPTVNGDEGEAALDAEWAGVAAPDADIVLAECNDTQTTFGGEIAAQNLLNSAAPPPIISLSYGLCEAGAGDAMNASFNTMWQQAVAEGTTVFVSSGDQAATGCSAGNVDGVYGIGVNGFASSPYDVAVGGTDFRDVHDGTTTTYWSPTNNADGGSALSYIPEIPWNDSCAGGILIDYLIGQGTISSTDPVAFCNSSAGQRFVNISTGSGGPSQCATGSASNLGVVGGTCAGYAKPTWQAGVLGVPNDNVRGLPDVSLFASNGFWSHAMWLCDSDYTEGGGTCDYANNTAGAAQVNAAGGTSFAAPAFAGIQALINQAAGDRQGNMNVLLYQIAAQQYGSTANPNVTGLSECNANQGNATGSTCVFHDVTSGDIFVPCGKNTPNCYLTGASNTSGNCARSGCGILSTSLTAEQPAYPAAAGWDFATGLGSVDAANLVAAVLAAPVADTLQFVQQPQSSYNATDAIAVAVAIEDGTSQIVAGDETTSITLFDSTCPSMPLQTQTVIDGVAQFTVHLRTASTNVRLIASANATPPISTASDPFDVSANQDLIFAGNFEQCVP
jgi:subtilase family serine protease